MDKAFFVSIPHSGEKVPDEAPWLKALPEPILMCDVDRFVDQLYLPSLKTLNVPTLVCEWHRYAADLNRLPDDVDANSVVGSINPKGSHNTGLHWVQTTKGYQLMPHPISKVVHEALIKNYFDPFHQRIRNQYENFRKMGHKKIFHIDAHSMPSMGTAAHRDPGNKRAEIVISDVDGKSSGTEFKDLVIAAYKNAGFEVAYNWPYKGGRLTQTYGKPDEGQHVVQVEMNRSIYMDEETKQKVDGNFQQTQAKLESAVRYILDGL